MARKIEVQIVGDSKSLEAALARSGAKTLSFGDKMKQTGRTLTTHLTLPIVALGAVAVKTTADFESSMEKIQGLVGASSKQMDHYREAILSLAPAVAKGPKELADALYFVTSSGFKGAQALDILRKSAQASTAGLGDTQQIADLVTSAITAYGDKALDAAKATDILVAATKAGKGDPQEFAQALQLNVSAAEQLGISFDQLAAATAALSTVNSNVSEDATQLSGIMQALAHPSKQAADVLHKVGLSMGEIRQEVKDKGLLPTLLDLKNKFHGNVEELNKLFPNVRGARGFLTLVGKAAERNVSIFDQVAHSTGDMSKAFKAALTNDPTKQWEKMKAQLQVLAIVIGESLIPMLTTAAGWVTTLAAKFNGLSEGQQQAILIAVGLVAALGPVVSIVGNLITVLKAARVAMIAFGVSEGIALGWVALIVVGVIALGAALVVAYQKSRTFRNVVNAAFNAIKSVAGAVVDFISAHWRALVALIPGIGPVLFVIVNHFQTFKRVVGAVASFARSKLNTVVDIVQTLWSWITSLVDAVNSLISALRSIPTGILDRLSSLAGSVGGVLGNIPHTAGEGGGVAAGAIGFGGRTNPTQGTMHVHVYLDGKEIHSSVQSQDKVYRRQNGRSAFAA